MLHLEVFTDASSKPGIQLPELIKWTRPTAADSGPLLRVCSDHVVHGLLEQHPGRERSGGSVPTVCDNDASSLTSATLCHP